MTLLSVTVPTFNRAVLLDFFLKVHAPVFHKHGVPLFIADNASIDDTAAVCSRWASRFPNIVVRRFDVYVETDESFHRALMLPKSRYVWLMGDGYEVTEVMLMRTIELLSSGGEYDHVTINLISLSDAKFGREYRRPDEVAIDLFWLMTCMSCNIYGERLLAQSQYQRFYNSRAIQAAIALDFMGDGDFCFYFAPEISVVSLKCRGYRKTGWGHDYFEVGFNQFPRLILMLCDQLTVEDQTRALRAFFARTPIFFWRHLINMRANGWLHSDAVLRHQSTIHSLTSWRFQLLLSALTFLPYSIARALSSSIDVARTLNYRLRKKLGVWGEGR